jgi:hypothetical protein
VILTVQRKPSYNGTTLGVLLIDGVQFAETLEDTVRNDGKVWGQTAIPAGTYPVTITKSQRFGKMLPLIENVPGFSGIRIHAGSSQFDTEGCILVGQYHVGAELMHSRIAMEALMSKLAPVVARGESITLIVENAPAVPSTLAQSTNPAKAAPEGSTV